MAVFDMSDRSNLTLLREVEVDGYYASSRRVGSAFYLVANLTALMRVK